MKPLLLVPAGIALITLAACETVTAPIYDRGDLSDARLEVDSLNFSTPITPVVDLPLGGSATYRGMVASDIGGDYRGNMVGDIRMDVRFGTAGDVEGQITNMTLLGVTNVVGDPDMPNQTLDGALAIDARRLGNAINGTAGGEVVAVNDLDLVRRFDVDLTLGGNIRTDFVPADAITGKFDGNGENVNAPEDDMGFVNGVFYATR